MQTQSFTEGRHAAEFVLSEASFHRSRDNLLLAASQTIIAGAILVAAVVAGGVTASAAPDAGNTVGSGTITMDATTPILAGAQNGTYRAVCIAVAANGGTFEVIDPKGKNIGKVAVGATFSKQIKFVINDATDFAAGDAFSITVGVEDGDLNYSALTTAGAGDMKLAIALYNVTTGASETTTKTAGITRDAEVAAPRLIWPSGIAADVKASVINALAAQGIIVR